MSVIAQQLWFRAPRDVEVREATLAPAAHEVLVTVHCSAVSAGTELLVYRGEVPEELALDSNIAALQQRSYPLRYGYAAVGTVSECGSAVDASWLGRRVFAFQPHASHYVTDPANLILVPDAVSDEAAVFLANMETAVNLVQDGAPLVGERVAVFGLGIVGLLTSALLTQFPLGALHAIDPNPQRRAEAAALGIEIHAGNTAESRAALAEQDFDLLFEVSGSPQALEWALALSGYCSRLIVGSWYGDKVVDLPLGGAAHRNRLHIRTSQVSTLAPALSGRWTKERRFETAWTQLQRIEPQRWIDARLTLQEAAALYLRLDAGGETPLQALFVY